MMVEFGWRGRGIALAALGAAVLGRSAFALTRSGGLIPIEMQSLVYLALANEHSLPSAPGVELGSLARALVCDPEEVAIAVDSLVRRGLVAYPELAEGERAVVTAAGVAKVDEWLSLVVSLFEGWPPAVPDVDDATG
jgi:DNA-binding MarR family transcriptional regulator